jgi:hypothetical protein
LGWNSDPGSLPFRRTALKTHREVGPRLVSDGYHTETTDDYKSDLAAEARHKKENKIPSHVLGLHRLAQLIALAAEWCPQIETVRRLGEITDNVYQNGAILILSQPGSAMQRRNQRCKSKGLEIQRVGSQSRITMRRPSSNKELCSMEGGTCSPALSQW